MRTQGVDNEKTHKVFLYKININEIKEDEETLLLNIAPHYARKYEKCKVYSSKMHELGAGSLLAKYLNITKDEQLFFNEYGKPMLKGINKEFSLSHSGDYVVLAISDIPVGVDIERIDRVDLRVLERVLPPAYYEKIKNDDSVANNAKELTKCWTSVEAILKARGEGFYIDPRADEKFMEGWFIENKKVEDDYMISIALAEPFELQM
ncbi:4'-phosphopantetheinyl transferase family protein [Butyrivibrio sp. JL13D10]|uniref:4'-phosphopantetheinyl transferase family protein n=1 Tax=Butyrivibrio sp. JL13D10 TaxID=3236815 RepID=UPI0038B4BF0D